MGEEALKGHALEMGFITLLPSFQLQFVSCGHYVPSDQTHDHIMRVTIKTRGKNVGFEVKFACINESLNPSFHEHDKYD